MLWMTEERERKREEEESPIIGWGKDQEAVTMLNPTGMISEESRNTTSANDFGG